MLQKVEYMLYFVEASCTYRNSLIGENYVTSEEQSILLITSFILGDAVFQYMLQHQCPIQKCIALQGTTFHERIVCVLVFVEAQNTILTFSYYILFQLKKGLLVKSKVALGIKQKQNLEEKEEKKGKVSMRM